MHYKLDLTRANIAYAIYTRHGQDGVINAHDWDSVMNVSVEGPSATKKQKIEDRASLR